jgi:hypothetical protein
MPIVAETEEIADHLLPGVHRIINEVKDINYDEAQRGREPQHA